MFCLTYALAPSCATDQLCTCKAHKSTLLQVLYTYTPCLPLAHSLSPPPHTPHPPGLCPSCLRVASFAILTLPVRTSLSSLVSPLIPLHGFSSSCSEGHQTRLIVYTLPTHVWPCAGDGFDMPQASASFTAPDVLAAVVHLASSNEGWTLPVDFLAHDKWSLGCILSFMLSGCVAFDWPANQPPSSPSLEDEYACVLQRQQEWVSTISCACFCRQCTCRT